MNRISTQYQGLTHSRNSLSLKTDAFLKKNLKTFENMKWYIHNTMYDYQTLVQWQARELYDR